MRQLLVITLHLLSAIFHLAKAQSGLDVPLNGKIHFLPVAFAKSDTQQFVHLKDTFFIKNNRDKEVVVDFSWGGYSAQTMLEKEKVAPFGTNSISYADRIKVLPDQFQWIRNGAYYKTKYYHGASFLVHAFVVDANAPVRSKKGEITRFEKPNIDGLTREMIYVNEALIPTSHGTKFIDSDSAIGTWSYYKTDTFPTIVQKAKRIRITLQNPNDLGSKISISLKRNKKWSKVAYGKEGETFICYIDSNTNSLKLESNGLIAAYPIKYSNLRENQTISVYLIHERSEFRIQNQIKIPINFDSNRVVLHWNIEEFSAFDSTVVDASTAAKSLQKEFKTLTILPYPENSFLLLVDFKKVSYSEKKRIFEELEKRPYIYKICALFIDDIFGRTHYADDAVIVEFTPETNNTKIAELAAAHNFTLSQRMSGGMHYFLKYKRPVFDIVMLRDMQALGMHPNVVSASPNSYYRIDTGEFPRIDTPLLRAPKSRD
jgi:hypothetical protein